MSPEDISNELNDVLNQCKESPKKVLLVTDYIWSGGTVRTFKTVFEARSVQHDIASLVVNINEDYLRKKERIGQDTILYTSRISHEPPSIHAWFQLTGLSRNSSLKHRVIREEHFIPEKVRQTRKGVNILARKILDRLT